MPPALRPGPAGHGRIEDRQAHPSTGRSAATAGTAARSGTTSTRTPRRRARARHRGRAHLQPGRPRAMGYDHPISWCSTTDGGRVWATAMGHADRSPTARPTSCSHILGGVKWAAGNLAGDCGGTVWGNFEKVTLDENTADPIALDVAPDGRVFYIQRAAAGEICDPATNAPSRPRSSSTSTPAARTASSAWPSTRLRQQRLRSTSTTRPTPPATPTDINRVSRFTCSTATR